MKSFIKIPLVAILLIIAPTLVVQAQDSRIQLASLDHLAAKASQTVDVNIDERLIRIAFKVLSDKKEDEKEIKKLVSVLKGIYVKRFEFDADGLYTPADVESIRTQLRSPGWSRMVNVTSRKEGILEVYVMLTGEQISGLAVLHSDTRELTVVNIVGPLDLAQLAELEGQFGVPDLEIQTEKKPKPKNDEK